MKHLITLASYFAGKPLYLDEPTQKKPNTRKLVEQPWQQTKGEMWDEVTNTLCNLDFIQAKAAAKMTYDLVNDFYESLEVIPDNQENINAEKARQNRLDKYTQDLIACAKGEISIEELEIPESITPWTSEQTIAEIERIKTNPNLADRLKDFLNFLGQEADNLQNYANNFSHFAYQQAWNYADCGPVGVFAEKGTPDIYRFLLLYNTDNRPRWNPSPQTIKTIKKHSDCVLDIAITPDGHTAISSSWDGSCIVWDLNTGKTINILKGQNGMVKSVAITAQGGMAISGNDHGCIVWDLINGQAINTFKERSIGFKAFAITPDGKQTVTGDYNTITIWNSITGQAIQTLYDPTHCSIIQAVAITPDGEKVISCSENKTCILWNIRFGKLVHLLKGHSDEVTSVAITPDGNRAITGSDDMTCILWNLKTGKAINILKGHRDKVLAVDITPDGKRAISGSSDETCIIWDLNSGQAINILKGHTDSVTSVSITPDGLKALSGSGDNTCILWNLNSELIENYNKAHTEEILSITITPDNKKAISSSGKDNFCILWDLNTGMVINTLKGNSSCVFEVVITPDGKKAISSDTYNNSCIIWDLSTGQVINTLKGHTSRVTKVKITADGNRIISGSDDTTCIIWDLYSGKMIHSLKGHADNILALAITSDGKKCITGAHSDHCFIWDIDTGQVINNSLKRYIDENINSIVIAYDGRRRRSISLLKGYGIPKYPIADTYDLKITPDGKRAISLCNDITCGIWNMNSGKVIIALVGNSKIFSVAITPDGKRAITGSSDNKCILWNLNSGEAIKTFNGHTDRVISVAITPDGKRAISGSIDNTCIIWDLDTGEKVGLFVSTSPIYIVKFYFLGLLVGDRHGKISILKANKELLCPQYSIVTINRIWDFNLHQYLPMSADCPSCGHRFEPNILILNTIEQITIQAGLRPDQSPCLELTDEVWENPGLLGECPECHEKLKFNPFLGSDLTENENCIEASEILYSKMFDEAENAFNMRLWEKAYDLYLKLVQQGMYDLNIVYFNMAICQLNRLKTNREKIISDIKNLEALLSSKGKKREAQMITDKLNERLASIKPWWKKMF